MAEVKPAVIPRIGVFVCHCGRNIAGTVDIRKVVEEISKYPGVVHVEDYKYMCSEIGQELIIKAIKEKRLNAVVVAACSPAIHYRTFFRTVERAGLNPFRYEHANIREQCSWVHTDKVKATRKAIQIIKAAIEKVKRNLPLEPYVAPITKRALVIGGGIAGMQAALDIANAGYEVVLVEKSPTIGGHMAQLSETFPTLDCAQCILTPRMAEVWEHPNIRIYTLAEVVEVDGVVGNFRVKIRQKPRYVDITKCNLCGECEKVCPVIVLNEFDRGLSLRKAIYLPFPQAVPPAYVIDIQNCLGLHPVKCGKCVEVCEPNAININDQERIIEENVGAIIVATGYDLYPKEKIPEYGYGKYEDVIDALQFERLLSVSGPTGGEIRRPSDWKVPKTVVWVSCVGSRDVNHLEYCSKICCMYIARQAMMYRRHVPDGKAIVFYIDIRAAGKGYEEFIKRVQEEYGVIYIRGRVSKIYKKGDKLIVKGIDTLTGKKVEVEADMVVLATGIIPSEGTKKLAEILKIPVDKYGFLHELHPKLNPVETLTSGIFICGAAHAPKDISESVLQASASASKVIELFSKTRLTKAPQVATVNEEICSGCGTCESVCPFGAVQVIDGKAQVETLLCHGCGLCSASCPTGAMELKNYTTEQLLAQVRAALS